MSKPLQRWIGRVPDISAVIARFPVAVAAMAIVTVLLIVFKNNFYGRHEALGGLCLGLVAAAYMSVSMTVAAEGQGKSRNLAVQIGLTVIIGALGFFAEQLRLSMLMAIGAAILLLGNAVRWRRGRDDLHVWDFTHKLWTGAVFAVVGSIIFMIGMLAISQALKSLFGIRIDDLVQDFIFPIGFAFLAPLYWLSTLPSADEDYSELYDNPGFVSKAVAFLGTWLLAPLTLIYALILLAYGVKIGTSMSLPKGEIATLTLPFLIIGTLTWLVLDPPFIREKFVAKLFRRAWWPLSIPAALMLAVAVFVRIREYGYTPERFALTVGVTWALVMGLWFSFGPKAKRDIRLIPGSAAILLLLGTVTAGWLSVTNQSMRLSQNLVTAGIMNADGTAPTPITIRDTAAARKAKGALLYLMRKDEEDRVAKILAATDIKVRVEKTDAKNTDVDFHPEKYRLKDLEAALGLDKVSMPSRWMREYEIRFSRDDQNYDVSGFDTLRGPFSLYKGIGRQVIMSNSAIKASAEKGVMTLSFSPDEKPLIFDPRVWIEAQNFEPGEIQFVPDVVLLDEAERKISLVITNFSVWRLNRDDVEEDMRQQLNIDFYILTAGL